MTLHVGNVKNVFSPYEKRETRNNWGFPGSSAGEESACNAVDLIHSLGWEIPWRRDRVPTPVFLGFPGGSDGKEFTCNVGDLGWEDPLEKGMAAHSSILARRIPMDRGSWRAMVQGLTESQTRLSNLSTAQQNT